jgi:hypothetical protein
MMNLVGLFAVIEVFQKKCAVRVSAYNTSNLVKLPLNSSKIFSFS